MAGLLDYFFGSGPSNVADTRPPGYPTADDVANARKYDVAYGSPAAAFVQPQPAPQPLYAAPQTPYTMPPAPAQAPKPLALSAPPQPYAMPPTQPVYSGMVAQPSSIGALIHAFNSIGQGQSADTPVTPVSPRSADNLMAGYLATQRSALAALGYDPHNMVMGDTPPASLSLGGIYAPRQDTIASTGIYPSTTVHESMHRGMQMLRTAGMLPPDVDKLSEEALVRAQMLRHYGGVEQGRGKAGDAQVSDGAFYNKSFAPQMDAVEKAAQTLYAKQHAHGPH